MDSKHQTYMSLALQLAERGALSVSPNPMVGCVIVKNDEIVGTGFHQVAGQAHAEIYALQAAGDLAAGATMYVTLEPCSHVGKTLPCVDALIAAKIKEVYIAVKDPNPKVSGEGIAQLIAAGINVHLGLMADKARQLNEIFFHFMETQRPFIIAKWAMSLDGKTIAHPADSRTISSAASHFHCHQIRRRVDAILIGANTARLDNPSLTARLKSEGDVIAKQPIRIVLTKEGKLPLNLKLFNDKASETLIATTDRVDSVFENAARQKQIEIVKCQRDEKGRIHLPSLLNVLAKKNITSILVEGGNALHQQFFEEKLVDKIDLYLCPVIIGTLEKKQQLHNVTLTKVDSDFYVSANFRGESSHV